MATGKRPSTVLPFVYADTALAASGVEAPPQLPSVQDETWKYTNLARLAETDFAGPTPVDLCEDDIARLAPYGGSEHLVVIANGALVPGFGPAPGDVPGLDIELAAPGSAGDHLPLAAMNAALPGDCVSVRLSAGTRLQHPLRIVFVASSDGEPRAWHPRIEMELGENAEATVIEQHIAAGDGAYWSNVVVAVSLAEGAALHHYRHQGAGSDAWHTAATIARLTDGAVYDNFVLSTGAALSRNEVHVELAGEGAACHLNGAYLMDGSQHADTTTVVDHLAPACTSRQNYRGVLDGKSRGVFQGQVKVARGAQKTDGEQMSRTILLSREAEMDTKPELEIYADDVKCAHGATVGELEDEQLFYLRTRGLSLDAARSLLIEGFMSEQLGFVADPGTRGLMADAVKGWLEARATRAAV